jgi:hypothetical protein
MKQERVKGNIQMLVGLLVLVVLLGAFAGIIFSSVNSTSLGVNAPAWTVTVFPVVVGITLLLLVLKLTGLY